MIKVNKMAFSK